MQIKIYALAYKGHHHIVSEDEAAEYPEDLMRCYSFECKAYDGAKTIETGRLMNAAGLVNDSGVGDADALAVARGQFIGLTVIQGWNHTTSDGAALDITLANIGTLPPEVLAEFGVMVSRGPRVTQSEIEALKKKPPTSTESL